MARFRDALFTKNFFSLSIRKNVWHEIVEGLGYMFSKSKMKIVTSTLFLLMAGAGSIFCIIIVFIQESFKSVTEDIGIMGVFLGAGLFLGTLLYGKFGQNLSKIRSIFTSFTFCGVAVALFAFYSSGDPVFFVGGGLIMMIGMVTAPILICTNTLIHVLVPDEVRGRIFSSVEAIMHLAFLIFMFLTAYLSKHLSKLTILLASGIIFAVIGSVGQALVRRKNFSIKI